MWGFLLFSSLLFFSCVYYYLPWDMRGLASELPLVGNAEWICCPSIPTLSALSSERTVGGGFSLLEGGIGVARGERGRSVCVSLQQEKVK